MQFFTQKQLEAYRINDYSRPAERLTLAQKKCFKIWERGTKSWGRKEFLKAINDLDKEQSSTSTTHSQTACVFENQSFDLQNTFSAWDRLYGKQASLSSPSTTEYDTSIEKVDINASRGPTNLTFLQLASSLVTLAIQGSFLVFASDTSSSLDFDNEQDSISFKSEESIASVYKSNDSIANISKDYISSTCDFESTMTNDDQLIFESFIQSNDSFETQLQETFLSWEVKYTFNEKQESVIVQEPINEKEFIEKRRDSGYVADDTPMECSILDAGILESKQGYFGYGFSLVSKALGSISSAVPAVQNQVSTILNMTGLKPKVYEEDEMPALLSFDVDYSNHKEFVNLCYAKDYFSFGGVELHPISRVMIKMKSKTFQISKHAH